MARPPPPLPLPLPLRVGEQSAFMARFLVLGGAHTDRRARLIENARMGASNPGHWEEEHGGGALNAARSLVQLGHTVRLVSARGDDPAGMAVARTIKAAGILDMSEVFPGHATPGYSAILEPGGDLVIGVADMALYEHFTAGHVACAPLLAAMDGADLVLCDANLPAQTLERLAALTHARQKRLAAIAISPAKILRLQKILPALCTLFLNAAEASALCGPATRARDWPDHLRRAGLACAVVTRGAQPAIAFDPHRCFEITPPVIDSIADVTGAGDALAAATLDRIVCGQSFDTAVRAGMAAALLALRSSPAVPPDLTRETLHAALARIPQPVFRS